MEALRSVGTDGARSSFTPWQWLMARQIGILPLPLFAAASMLIAILTTRGSVHADLTTNILILTVGGFACAEIGKYLPGLRKVGAPAIMAAFVPSYLVYAGVIPAPLKAAISTFTEQSNFLYLFIGSIIVGSILGMDRRMLVSGFLKILAPVAAGSIVAAIVGCAVGSALGLGLRHTAFMIVVPVLGGGVGEGAIPLSVGYATLAGGREGEFLAAILPAVMFGNLAAVLGAGIMNLLGKRRPHLTGNGALQPGEHDEVLDETGLSAKMPELPVIGAAVVLAMTLYTIGALVQDLSGFPGPVAMLFLALAIKLARLVPSALEQGAHRSYRFFAQIVTFPLLFALGVAKTPWEKLVSAFNVAEMTTILSTVVALVVTGYFVGRLVKLHPIEAAIITACRASQGGTGDVAILSAANRIALMPFAQVATRIGGAITVTIALGLFALYGQ